MGTPRSLGSLHPGNRYAWWPLDFDRLAANSPGVRSVCVTRKSGETTARVDWSLPAAAYEVAKATLQLDFGIHWWLPHDDSANNASVSSVSKPLHLTPSVSRSLNYLNWARDLLVMEKALGNSMPERPVVIDIGTGASCIFPLLGCKLAQDWDFVASDIDGASVAHARKLVQKNGCAERVHIELSDPGQMVSHLDIETKWDRVAFVMCNPPFFGSFEPSLEERTSKRARVGTDAEFHGTASERSFKYDGEVGFFQILLKDSMIVAERRKTQPIWFSCMFGHKSSLRSALRSLQESSATPRVHATTLSQGERPRWVVAWMFGQPHVQLAMSKDTEASNQVAAPDFASEQLARVYSAPTSVLSRTFSFPLTQLDVDTAWQRVLEFFETLPKHPKFYSSLVHHIPDGPRASRFFIVQGEKVYLYTYARVEKITRDGDVAMVALSNLVFHGRPVQLNDTFLALEPSVLRTSRKWRRLQMRKEQLAAS